MNAKPDIASPSKAANAKGGLRRVVAQITRKKAPVPPGDGNDPPSEL